MSHNSKYLQEEIRSTLMAQGRKGAKEKDGKSRYEKRTRSKVASIVKKFNQIDMQTLFTLDILTFQVPVKGETADYVVTLKFEGFLEELRRMLEKAPTDEITPKIVTQTLASVFNKNDIYVHCTCLHPNTKIKLFDGTTPTVEEMKKRYDNGEQLYVYSVDEKGEFVPGTVEKVWVTTKTNGFVKITLDNGEEVMTTPDHLYMKQDGDYISAEELEIGMSLMSSCLLNNKIIASNNKVTNIEFVILETPIPVYDIKVKEQPNFLLDSGVVVHNCPDATFRMNYWTTVNGINSGEPETRPSKITNPYNRLGPGCKHVMCVLANNSWIIPLGSTITNYIKYMEKSSPKAYADIIYPAIYGKEFESPVQTSLFDTETGVDTSAETVDVANELGRRRGQFRKLNQTEEK